MAVALALSCGASIASAEPLNVVDLGYGTGYGDGYSAVNDAGQVAGTMYVDSVRRAVRWADGQMTPVGGAGTGGADIDPAGGVYGNRFITDDQDKTYAYLWYVGADGAEHTDTSLSGGSATAYREVTPNGTVLGTMPSGDPGGSVGFVSRPPYTERTNIHMVGSSVNDAGHVAGTGQFYNGTELVPENISIYAFGHSLNVHDEVVGTFNSGTGKGRPAIAHADTSVSPLADPYPDAFTQPVAINDDGLIVGYAEIYGMAGGATALEWRPDGTVVTLDSLLPPGSPWHLSRAMAISNTGYILGLGFLAGSDDPHYFLITGQPSSLISGTLADRAHTPLANTRVTVSGTADDGTAVSRSLLTDATGAYSLTVAPGTYTAAPGAEPPGQNGGTWSASPCSGNATPTTGACALGKVPAGAHPVASFVYTQCSADERHPNGKPPTGCPIVFVPGFLGSRVVCSTGEMWPGLPFPAWAEMALLPDGRTNSGRPGSCAATAGPVPGQEGVVQYVAGVIDIYGGALKFLNRIAPGRVYAYPYDWRRSVYDAVDGLDRQIDKAREDTGANRVAIMAHSMGGLVTRAYVDSTAHAAKVTRVVTLGTPYWGAPKSHFALLGGYTDTNENSIGPFSLDNVTKADDLEALARTAAGLYWLYPSASLGPWLSVSDLSHEKLRPGGVDQWVKSLGGSPALLDAAQAGHAALDTLKTNDVDYAVVVGAGTPTVTAMAFDSTGNEHHGVGFWATMHYGSGDGTVPLTSATMGVSAGAKAIASTHYVCGVGHVGLPNDAATQLRIKDYLLDGGAVSGPENNCPFTGTEVTGGRIAPSRLSVRTASGTMTIAQARTAGLISMSVVNDQDFIVLDDRRPVTLSIDARKLALQVTRLGVTGAAAKRRSYGPVSGTLTVGNAGTVTSNGKVLKAVSPSRKAPKTVARVTRRGSKYRVVLRARSKNGIVTTFYRFGRAATRTYTKAFSVSRKRLRALRFASVDGFGRQEKPHRARLRKARRAHRRGK